MPSPSDTEADSGKIPSSGALLVARGVSKSFPGVRALDSVDFTLRSGEIHALLGENGAGKSTLIKVLTGVYRRDAGKIELAGRPIAPRGPLDAQRLGISTVYQEVNLIPYLSVAENIYLGHEPRRWGCIQWGAIRQGARALLERLALRIDVTQPLNSYSVAIQQMAAIARALRSDDTITKASHSDANETFALPGGTRILILDEPTSSLDAAETEQLFAVMRRLKNQGLGIIFITHFIDQVYQISDRLTVLRNGKLVGEYETAVLPRLELVARMIGQDLETASSTTASRQSATARSAVDATRRPVLRARAIGRRGVIHPLDIRIDAGEVVGLAGLLGSGRTETAEMLFGISPADEGSIEVDGRQAKLNTPRAALQRRLAFCPEDRKTAGIFPELSIRENVILALQARLGWHRPLSRKAETELASRYIEVLRIATPDIEKPIGQLSGGNQQKAILARWLASDPLLLIVDEPTRGIDVGAKAEIEKLIAALRERGLAILFISSEMEEVVRNCQRVAVLRDRRKIGELAGEEIKLSTIVRMIAEHESVE